VRHIKFERPQYCDQLFGAFKLPHNFVTGIIFYHYHLLHKHKTETMSDSTFEALANIPGHVHSFAASIHDGKVIQVRKLRYRLDK
jgi:hypothetical protein